MRRLASVLALALGLALFAYNATRMGMDASAIRRAQRNQERFGALEAMMASQDAKIAMETDLLTSGSTLSVADRTRAAERLALAQLVRQRAQLELEDHSSKSEAQTLNAIYAGRTEDDLRMQAGLLFLVTGMALAPTRKDRPVLAGRAAL